MAIPKRWLAVPAALTCVFALCLLVNLPAAVTTAAADRQLPVYCVQKDTKVCSLSFDAAWGNAILRRRDFNGLRAGFWENQSPARVLSYDCSHRSGIGDHRTSITSASGIHPFCERIMICR